MTTDGFLNQKQRHPTAMVAAIAINAAAVAAVMLAKNGYVVVPHPGAIPIIDIFIPQPPPPNETPEPPQAQQPKDPVFVPPPRVPTGAETQGDPIETTHVLPPTGGTSGGEGASTAITPKPEPSPVPVLTDAAPLSGALRDFQPPYPPQLLRTGIEGTAVVRVLVGTNGRVKQVAIISAGDPLFADATERQALRKWRFKPATRDGVAVESWKQMTVRFEIRA